MSRVVTLESKGKERIQYQRAIILALQELMKQSEVNDRTRDLSAFIVLTLEAIDATIEQSVAAWEKRGYWLKADRFRLEWNWAGDLAKRMRFDLQRENWEEIRLISAQVFVRLSKVSVPLRHGIGTPWVGAWEKFAKKNLCNLT